LKGCGMASNRFYIWCRSGAPMSVEVLYWNIQERIAFALSAVHRTAAAGWRSFRQTGHWTGSVPTAAAKASDSFQEQKHSLVLVDNIQSNVDPGSGIPESPGTTNHFCLGLHFGHE
jgi:hypothetical protein